MGCVYQATHKDSGKKYIGKTIQKLNARIREHKRDSIKGTMTYFHRAIAKHGLDAFKWDILFESDSDDALLMMEKEFIKLLATKAPLGYNLTDGGQGMAGHVQTPEHKAKIGAVHRGKIVSQETREKLRRAQTGRKCSLEARLKMSASRKGKKNKPMSEEARARIKPMSDATKAILRAAQKKYWDAWRAEKQAMLEVPPPQGM